MLDRWGRTGVVVGIGIVVGLLNGLLAVGGTLLVPASVSLLRLNQHEAHGTSLWVILPTSIVSLTVYIMRRGVALDIGWKIALGGIVGAVVGAKLLNRLPGLWLKRLFATLMMIAALRMLWDR